MRNHLYRAYYGLVRATLDGPDGARREPHRTIGSPQASPCGHLVRGPWRPPQGRPPGNIGPGDHAPAPLTSARAPCPGRRVPSGTFREVGPGDHTPAPDLGQGSLSGPEGPFQNLPGKSAPEITPLLPDLGQGSLSGQEGRYPLRNEILHKDHLAGMKRRGLRATVFPYAPTRRQYLENIAQSKTWLGTTINGRFTTRYFDIMSSGTTLLLCNRAEGSRVYDGVIAEGVTAVTFGSLEEFDQKVAYYADSRNQGERERIARQAREAVMANMTWASRARQVLGACSP